jgi:hypothetical protein
VISCRVYRLRSRIRTRTTRNRPDNAQRETTCRNPGPPGGALLEGLERTVKNLLAHFLF